MRNKGYDVIDYGNAENFNHNNTKLKIHNKNHENFIFEIVEILSINPDKLEYNYSKTLSAFNTCVISTALKLFFGSTKKNVAAAPAQPNSPIDP